MVLCDVNRRINKIKGFLYMLFSFESPALVIYIAGSLKFYFGIECEEFLTECIARRDLNPN